MNPRDAGACLELGKSCRGQGRWSESEAALNKALELDPRNGGARFELGVLYRDQGRFMEAAAEFEGAIALDPNLGWAYFELGRICHRQGQVPEAEAALRKALELDPRNAGARIELGALCREQGRFAEAAAEFEGAIALDPDLGWAHCELGRIYRRQGRLAEAEAALRKALELAPQNSCARFEMGSLHQDQGRCPEAAAEFERAAAIDPNHGETHCQLGRTYRRQGRLSEAEAALHRALELDPENGWARLELGALYEDQGKILEAAAELEKAITIDPHNVGARIHSGHIHLRLGRWAEAVAEFQRASALDPRNDGAFIGLFGAYRGQGRSSEAAAALAKATAINPKSAFACTALVDRLDRDRVVGEMAARDGSADGMGARVFCLLPWTCLHMRTDGSFCPCCMWSGPPLGNARSSSLDELWNSPGMKALRSDMMSGRPVAGCWRCYRDERVGFWSLRKKKALDLARHRDRERLTAPDGTLPRLSIPWLDIRFSNVCNLRCRICEPTQSSAWAADARALDLPVEGGPILKPYDDWEAWWRQLQPLLETGLEEISFLGGEPLIMEEHYRILDFLIAHKLTDVRLNYITNFSTLRFQARDVLSLWSRFRDVSVIASLDGSGRRCEYMRKGLIWDAVVANRQEMIRRCPQIAFSISATLSIFNALHLPDFHREWTEKGLVSRDAFTLNVLMAPEIYRIQVLPQAFKERVLESYRRHRESFLDADGEPNGYPAAERFLVAEDRSDLLPGFLAVTRRLDALRGEDCREVFPELAVLFEAAE